MYLSLLQEAEQHKRSVLSGARNGELNVFETMTQASGSVWES